ncbi:hypothetical protein [Solirubrobacter soli]|uniref:hypothetical protein n=1 Tax=Solirubrobacter soli TaxID=363832 RepID=UPI00041356F1|nr:hypothetical protein [Solirubrobacter soli]
MRRSLLTAALVLGVMPAAASAAPFGEVGFRPAGGIATCVRATGLPGELVRSTATGAQFLQASAAGLTPTADVASDGDAKTCPQAAARPNGVGIVAFAVRSGSEAFVRASLREAGGAWGPHVDALPVTDIASTHPLAAGISERGDAVVALAGINDKGRLQILAARRAPGGGFGATETLVTAPKTASSGLGLVTAVRVVAGVSAGGDAVVAWSLQPAPGKPRELWAAVAPVGAPFGAPAKVGALRPNSSFSLAVGDGGHALLAFVNGTDVLVAERAPGGAFGTPVRVGRGEDTILVVPAAAIRSDGGAIVAWNQALAGDVQAVARAQAGAFGAPVTIAPKSGLRYPKSILDLFTELLGDEDLGGFTLNGDGMDDDGGDARAMITADGRGVVTWAGAAQRDGVWWAPPLVATLPLTGGAPSHAMFGAELREAGATTPLLSADGALGVAWADNNDRDKDGRLHLALEGVPDGADPAPPALTVIAPKKRVLAADESLRFGVRCSAACDVRAQIGSGVLVPGDGFSLTRAGSATLSLDSTLAPVASLRGGPVTVRLLYASPGARHATTKNVTYRLRRLPDTPLPKVLGATARRDGDEVVVSWRTDRPAKRSNFAVFGVKDRDDTFDVVGYGDTRGSGRSFHVRLRGAGEARYVHIVTGAEGTRKSHTTTVRVRG